MDYEITDGRLIIHNTRLRVLDLPGTRVTDLSALAACAGLTHLDASVLTTQLALELVEVRA